MISAQTVEQLTANPAAATLELDADQMARLEEASATVPKFSASLSSPAIRRMIFDGCEVRGWGE